MVILVKIIYMEINNTNPSLFAKTLRHLLECAYERSSSDDKEKSWRKVVEIWFVNRATVGEIRAWLEDRAFPNQDNLHACIILAHVLLGEDETISPSVAFAFLDGAPEGDRQGVLEMLRKEAEESKERAPVHRAAAQEFLSVLELPIGEGFEFGEKYPIVTKINLKIRGESVRSIAEYYYRNGERSRDLLSVFNSILPYEARSYTMARASWLQHEICMMLEELVFPKEPNENEESIYSKVVRRKKFFNWAFEHPAELSRLGTVVTAFLKEKDTEVMEGLKTLLALQGPEILVSK